MGFSVGIPTLKLSNKVSSKATQRHTGKLYPVAAEGLEERISSDPDINRELTKFNEYQGIRTAAELVRVLNEEAESYSEARKAAGGRGLREDAAIGYACIVKPEKDAIMAMSPDDRRRFFSDAHRVLDGIIDPDGTNLRSRVLQVDEIAWHTHSFYAGWSSGGDKICVNDILNPTTWGRINREFPSAMRELGWEVDDVDLYDAERAASDPDYVEQRKEKRKQNGRSSERYKMDERSKDLDARENKLNEKEQDLQDEADSLEFIGKGVRKKQEKLKEDRDKLEADRRALEASRMALEQQQRETLRLQQEALRMAQKASETIDRADAFITRMHATVEAKQKLQGITGKLRRGLPDTSEIEAEAAKRQHQDQASL